MSELNESTSKTNSTINSSGNLHPSSQHHRSPYSSFYDEFQTQDTNEGKILYPSQQHANYSQVQTQNIPSLTETIPNPPVNERNQVLQSPSSNQFVYTMLSTKSKDHLIASPPVEVIASPSSPPENIYLGVSPKMTQEQLLRLTRLRAIYERLVKNDRSILPPQFQQSYLITYMGTNLIHMVWIFSFIMVGGRGSEPKVMFRNFLKFSFMCFVPYMMVRSMMTYTLANAFDYSYKGRTYDEIEGQLKEMKETTPILRY